jgi:hypothetical protein
MVARIYRPGCQVDNMVVLEGPQGIFKSSSLRVLAGDHHAEQHESVTSKDFFQNLQGVWLIEISEMHSFSRTETSKVKQVITCTTDHFRPSYGRRAVDHPRMCVFAGMTNHDNWSKDETGARRFWPITCVEIDLDGIRNAREQLFAEAVARFKGGETWWEMPALETTREQELRYDTDVWQQDIETLPCLYEAAPYAVYQIDLHRRSGSLKGKHFEDPGPTAFTEICRSEPFAAAGYPRGEAGRGVRPAEASGSAEICTTGPRPRDPPSTLTGPGWKVWFKRIHHSGNLQRPCTIGNHRRPDFHEIRIAVAAFDLARCRRPAD